MGNGVLKAIKDSALRAGNRALEGLLKDPVRAEKVAAAAGAVQRGKQRIDRAQGQILNALGFAHQGDYRELGKRLGQARRKAKAILERVSGLVDR